MQMGLGGKITQEASNCGPLRVVNGKFYVSVGGTSVWVVVGGEPVWEQVT